MNALAEKNLAGSADVSLLTQDGTTIVARVFKCPGDVRARLVVAGATGVPQTFYQAFAEFAASHGDETLTLDYRGIGQSKFATLKGYHMDYLDWAYQDLAAAVDHWHSSDAKALQIDRKRCSTPDTGVTQRCSTPHVH